MSEIRYFTNGEQATAEVLNRPLEDLEKVGQYMSENEFKRSQDLRKKVYGGSGILTSKTLANANTYGDTNIPGIYPRTFKNYPSESMINKITTIRSDVPSMNGKEKYVIDGVELDTTYLGYYDGILGNDSNIYFPDAPDITFESSVEPSQKLKAGQFIYLTDFTTEMKYNGDMSQGLSGYRIESGGSGVIEDGKFKYTVVNQDISKAVYLSSFDSDNFNFISGATYNLKINLDCDKTCKIHIYGYGTIDLLQGENNIMFKWNWHNTSSSMYFYIDGPINGDVAYFDNISVKLAEPVLAIMHRDVEVGDIIKRWDAVSESEISRQDFAFIETWHELVSEKGIVYPKGNVQWHANNVDGLNGIVEGSFEGYDGYSLFGMWQDKGTIIGKGYIWNNLSTDDKLKFASNPENNLYMTDNGIVQVRYRVRTIPGFGNNWYNAGTNSWLLSYKNGSKYYEVSPQGKRSITMSGSDIGISGWHYYISYEDIPGLYSTNRGRLTSSLGYTKSGNGLPLMLVQRRNKGAFHSIYNNSGTARFSDNKKWFETSIDVNSKLDCFTNKLDIIPGVDESGAPENYYAQGINLEDIKDLRKYASKVEDKEGYLNEQYEKYIQGKFRGNNIIETTSISEKLKIREANNYGYLRFDNMNNESVASLTYANNDREKYASIYSFKDNTPRHISGVDGNYSTTSALYPVGEFGRYTPKMGNITSIYSVDDEVMLLSDLGKTNFAQNGKHLVCDIIGDPKNYPTSWIGKNIIGTPNLVNSNYERNFPGDMSGEQNTIEVILNREVPKTSSYESAALVLAYMPDGTVKSLNYLPSYSTANTGEAIYWIYSESNKICYNTGTTDDVENQKAVLQVFYYTEAKRCIVTTSKIGLAETGFIESIQGNANNQIVNEILGKVSTVSSEPDRPMRYRKIPFNKLLKSTIDYRYLSMNDYGPDLEHESFKGMKDSATVKVYPFLNKSFNKCYLGLFYKELKYGNTDITPISVLPNDTIGTKSKGDIIKVDYGNGLIYIFEVKANITDSTDTYDSYYIQNGRVYYLGDYSISNKLKLLDGNYYGDNGSLELNTKETMLDDNNKSVLTGTVRIELEHFI